MLTEDERAIVTACWRQVIETTPDPGRIFYDQLFLAAPDLRPMFRGDLDSQARKLIRMITVAVHQLGDLDLLLPVLCEMGKRHVGYGVKTEHYAIVGTALMATLGLALRDAFTEEARAAWMKTYDVLSETMTAEPAAAE